MDIAFPLYFISVCWQVYSKSPGVPFQCMESAEIIPVEPDPVHAGAREVEIISSVPARPGALFL